MDPIQVSMKGIVILVSVRRSRGLPERNHENSQKPTKSGLLCGLPWLDGYQRGQHERKEILVSVRRSRNLPEGNHENSQRPTKSGLLCGLLRLDGSQVVNTKGIGNGL